MYLAEEFRFLCPWQLKIIEGFSAGKLERSLAPAEEGGEKAGRKTCTGATEVGIGKSWELYEIFMEYDLWDLALTNRWIGGMDGLDG